MGQKISLDATAHDLRDQAKRSPARRAAETVVGGHEHVMRQTVVALLANTQMSEHENPGEATVHVLDGRVVLTAGGDNWEARAGDLIDVPPSRHTLRAVDDSTILLTAVPGVRPTLGPG